MNHEEILEHFDKNPTFQQTRQDWDAKTTANFCRIAEAINSVGLDLWYRKDRSYGFFIVFGRKEQRARNANAALGHIRPGLINDGGLRISLRPSINGINELKAQPLTEELVNNLVEILESHKELISKWMPSEPIRVAGNWPNQLLAEEEPEEQEEQDEDNTILKHFDQKAAFKNARQNWTPETTTQFSQVVKALHDVGLDWWHVNIKTQVRFGRKQPNTPKAIAQFGSIDSGGTRITISSKTQNIIIPLKGVHLTPEVIDNLVGELNEKKEAIKNWHRLSPEREKAYWPDEISEEIDNTDINGKPLANLHRTLNRIYFGPPGTGKTYITVEKSVEIIDPAFFSEHKNDRKGLKECFDGYVESQHIRFVTFHQSYSYEEFIEGIKAETTKEGNVKYDVKSGVFKTICKNADSNPDINYVLIIDEINRGNISKIFGELITLIEDSKRQGQAEALTVTLPYSQKPFSVPKNLYLIGTMNTADRSLALIDTALRRRFHFIEMEPNLEILKQLGPIDGIELNNMLEVMNKRIEVLYDREHRIGHAFFMSLTNQSNINDLAEIFETKIIPLLKEYFFEDWRKICLVLSDNKNSENNRLIKQEATKDLSIFSKTEREEFNLENISLFTLNLNALQNPNWYINIYLAEVGG